MKVVVKAVPMVVEMVGRMADWMVALMADWMVALKDVR